VTSTPTRESATATPADAADPTDLSAQVADLASRWATAGSGGTDADLASDTSLFAARFLAALEAGRIRAAEADAAAAGGWRVNAWVKRGILLCFRAPGLRDWRDPIFAARDRSAFGLLDLLDSAGAREAAAAGAPWRVVPGGTTVRSGAHLEPGVTIMPPAYVNVGAWVGRGTMVDSHALVGSCAQIGRKVHLSAAAQVGGVLEPVGARPVIVEDVAFVGGGSGLYDGVVVGRGDLVLVAGAAGETRAGCERREQRQREHRAARRIVRAHGLPFCAGASCPGIGVADRVFDGGSEVPAAEGCGCDLPLGCRFWSAHLK
jgi:2,3,4,5-tetrahydropyridine-2,6-dicarboxylate N-succinyltransferase